MRDPAPESTWPQRLTKWLVMLGLALRSYHYARDPSLWHDEAALVLNVLDKSYAALLGPLFFSEAAPPLFLWLEKAMAGVLGGGTYALRAVPFLASCAAFLVVVACARRLLAATAVPWVALFFACSDRLLWHSCEAKPYAVDALIAAGLLAQLTFGSAWPLRRHLLVAAAATPLIVFLSYPGCFLLGGLAVCFAPAVLRSRHQADWASFGLFLVLLGGSFVLLLVGPVRAQRDPRILDCWHSVFPDYDRPWTLPGWLVQRSTDVVRYAYEPVGNALCPVLAVGTGVLWRQGRRRVVGFALLPAALAGVAALLKHYPFGAFRVMVFAAPGLLFVLGAGMPLVLNWLGRHGRGVALLLAGLAVYPAGLAACRTVVPWSRADAAGASAYVRARLQPGDLIAGNAWEHAYYFRDLGSTYRALDVLPMPDREQQVWLLLCDQSAEVRRALLRDMQAAWTGWRVVEEAEFSWQTVYRLTGPGFTDRPGPLAGR